MSRLKGNWLRQSPTKIVKLVLETALKILSYICIECRSCQYFLEQFVDVFVDKIVGICSRLLAQLNPDLL